MATLDTGTGNGWTTSNTMRTVWVAWTCGTSATTCATDSDTTWGYWATGTGTSNIQYHTNAATTWSTWNNFTQAVRTVAPEDAAAQIRRIEESRRRQAEIDRERTQAAQRAERLLLELLDEKQTEEYRKRKKFRVVGSDGETYEIEADSAHGNIKKLNGKGMAVEGYCVPLSDRECPTPDHIVAQLLALKANIDHLLEKANRWQISAEGTRRMLPRRQRA